MPVTMVDATVLDFEDSFEKLKAEDAHKRFLLFLADKDPASSLSWCPDCNVAEPVIYQKLAAYSDNVALLRAFVGDKPTWRNPSHPWRADPRFKLKGVPTLILWENEAIGGRLEDDEAHLEDKIEALLK